MAYVVLSIGLGFFILFLVSLAFPVYFKLDFSDGKPIVTIRRQSVLLPFTYYTSIYKDALDSLLAEAPKDKIYKELKFLVLIVFYPKVIL